MTKSKQIRDLYSSGASVSEIATRLGIKYQFAYNVLRSAGLLIQNKTSISEERPASKPALTSAALTQGGFKLAAVWTKKEGEVLSLTEKMPNTRGVYAFVCNGTAVYVGVTLRTLSERMGQYIRGHKSQPTNVVMQKKLLETLVKCERIEIYCASPPEGNWQGWPIDNAAGLEIALIKRFALPWNKKGV